MILKYMKILEKLLLVKEITIDCLLDYPYLIENYRTTGVDLSKKQVLDADLRDINFTGNLDRVEGAFMFFIFEKAKETVLDFL